MSIEGKIASLIAKINDKEETWQAIEELKSIANEKTLRLFFSYVNEPNWVVRWVLADIFSVVKDIRAIPYLVNLLLDKDFHVEQAAHKSLLNYGPRVIEKLAPYLSSPNFKIRKIIAGLLIHFSDDAVFYFKDILSECDLIAANRLVEIIARFESDAAKDILVYALDIESVQKSAIIFLGAVKYKKAIPKLLELFLQPNLKKFVLEALLLIDQSFAFELLIQELNSGSYNYSTYLESKIIEIGEPLISMLFDALKDNKNNREFIVQILQKMNLTKLSNRLHTIAKKDHELQTLTKELRKKYPYNFQKEMIKPKKKNIMLV
ncbi:MAG: HEAT repeat domain-containing protein [Candidatus Margulisiibacteriota bacterium]|jgi:HEAT repeat protein